MTGMLPVWAVWALLGADAERRPVEPPLLPPIASEVETIAPEETAPYVLPMPKPIDKGQAQPSAATRPTRPTEAKPELKPVVEPQTTARASVSTESTATVERPLPAETVAAEIPAVSASASQSAPKKIPPKQPTSVHFASLLPMFGTREENPTKPPASAQQPTVKSVAERTQPTTKSVAERTQPTAKSVAERTQPTAKSVAERTQPTAKSVVERTQPTKAAADKKTTSAPPPVPKPLPRSKSVVKAKAVPKPAAKQTPAPKESDVAVPSVSELLARRRAELEQNRSEQNQTETPVVAVVVETPDGKSVRATMPAAEPPQSSPAPVPAPARVPAPDAMAQSAMSEAQLPPVPQDAPATGPQFAAPQPGLPAPVVPHQPVPKSVAMPSLPDMVKSEEPLPESPITARPDLLAPEVEGLRDSFFPSTVHLDADTQAILASGIAACRQGEFDLAILAFNQAIAKDSRCGTAYCCRAIARAQSFEFGIAMLDLREALTYEPNLAEAHFHLAQIYAQRGDTQAAIDSFQKSLRPGEMMARAIVRLAEIYREQGNYQSAVALYTEQLRIRDDADYRLERARLHRQLGNVTQSLADIDMALTLRPHWADALKERVTVLDEGTDRDVVIDALTEYLVVAPTDNVVQEQLGREKIKRGTRYADCGQLDLAIADFTAVVALPLPSAQGAPLQCQALANRGLLLATRGEVAAGQKDCDDAVDCDSTNPLAFVARGTVRTMAGDPRGAIEDFSSALLLDSSLAIASHNRGLAYAEIGELDAAITDFTRAAEIEPHNVSALHNRAVAFQKKADIARDQLERAQQQISADLASIREISENTASRPILPNLGPESPQSPSFPQFTR